MTFVIEPPVVEATDDVAAVDDGVHLLEIVLEVNIPLAILEVVEGNDADAHALIIFPSATVVQAWDAVARRAQGCRR
jgi:hypothetical protein